MPRILEILRAVHLVVHVVAAEQVGGVANSREPIALHWPVIELAPVPGRPMLPVISARLMIACAVRVASWLWLTPIVHQNETRCPCRNCSGKSLELRRRSVRFPGRRAPA